MAAGKATEHGSGILPAEHWEAQDAPVRPKSPLFRLPTFKAHALTTTNRRLATTVLMSDPRLRP